MKIVRLLGIAIGLSVVGYLIHTVGLPAIGHTLGLLGWGYLVVLLYPLSWIFLNTAGWREILPPSASRISLVLLATVRLAGETFNSILPSGYVGGEPLKAQLLSAYMARRDAASSVLIAKSAQSVALVFFVTLGLTVGRDDGASPFAGPATGMAVAALAIGIGIFTWLLAHQSFSRLGAWLHRLTQIAWLQRQESKLIALDDSLGAFYRRGKKQFVISVFWHLGGWLAGALEVALIFWLLGHPVSWTQAWFIGAMAQLAAVVGLFSPAGVGFYEGGHYLAAQMLGLPPAWGLSVSLIRRVREIFWDAVGLGLFWKLSKQTPAQAKPAVSLSEPV